MRKILLAIVAAAPFFMATPRVHAADISPASLRVPDSAFAPAIVDPFRDRPQDNQLANSTKNDPFRSHHSMQYADDQHGADLHRVDGYMQRATWGDVVLSYEASTFQSPSYALNALRDGLYQTSNRSTMKAARSPETCTNVYHHPCAMLPYCLVSCSEGGQEGLYGVAQFNSCLIEVKAEASPAVFDQAKDTIQPALHTIMRVADGLMSQVCALPNATSPSSMDFDLIVTRVEYAGTGPDFSLTRPGLTHVRAGTRVYLSTYVSVTRAPRHCRVDAEFVVRRKQGVSFFNTVSRRVSTSPGLYRMVAVYTPRTPGRDVIVGRIAMLGVARTWTTAVRITK